MKPISYHWPWQLWCSLLVSSAPLPQSVSPALQRRAKCNHGANKNDRGLPKNTVSFCSLLAKQTKLAVFFFPLKLDVMGPLRPSRFFFMRSSLFFMLAFLLEKDSVTQNPLKEEKKVPVKIEWTQWKRAHLQECCTLREICWNSAHMETQNAVKVSLIGGFLKS